MTRVAIVGSEGKHWTPRQRTEVIRKIHDILMTIAIREGRMYQSEHRRPVVANPEMRGKTLITLVSGGCGARGKDEKQEFAGGVDVWAEIVADVLGIKKDIRYAPSMRWDDERGETSYQDHDGFRSMTIIKDGFKSRNLRIAQDCDVLYCIDPAWRKWSGGRYTMNEAKKLGKEVYLELIE